MNLANSKVLITGGAGFVGSHLADKLVEMGTQVVVIDNFDEFYSGKEFNINHNLKRENYKLVKGDILNFVQLSKAMKGVDIVFHQAAQAGLRYCNLNPMKAHNVNVTGTINVLTAAKQNRVKRVIYASSSSIFGVPQYIPIDEKHITNPSSPYGATKLAAEKYCVAFNNVYNLGTVCLRYFSVYGPRGRPDQVFYRFADRLLNGEAPLIFGDGNQTRDFTYISDVVDANILAAEVNEANGEVFNIGFGSELSIKDAAKNVIERLEMSFEPIYCETYKGDFPRTQADNSYARKILDWRPKIDVKEGLNRFTKWIKMNMCWLGSRSL